MILTINQLLFLSCTKYNSIKIIPKRNELILHNPNYLFPEIYSIVASNTIPGAVDERGL